MEIRQLKYFVGIAETGSFSEASRRFFLSQSAISQQIKALEDELNTVLFTRTSHHVKLTENGEILLPLARKTLEAVSECHDRMADINSMTCGELSIGLTYSLEPYVRDTIIRFLKSFPKVLLNVYYKSITELSEMLRKRQLDMIFCIDNNNTDDFTKEELMQYKLCAIMRDTHPLATRTQLTFSDLEKQQLILPEKGIRDRNAIEEYLSDKASSLHVKAVLNAPEAILNVVRNTNSIAILADICTKGDDTLHAVDIAELSNPVKSYVFTLNNSYVKKSAKMFLRLLKEKIRM